MREFSRFIKAYRLFQAHYDNRKSLITVLVRCILHSCCVGNCEGELWNMAKYTRFCYKPESIGTPEPGAGRGAAALINFCQYMLSYSKYSISYLG